MEKAPTICLWSKVKIKGNRCVSRLTDRVLSPSGTWNGAFGSSRRRFIFVILPRESVFIAPVRLSEIINIDGDPTAPFFTPLPSFRSSGLARRMENRALLLALLAIAANSLSFRFIDEDSSASFIGSY